MRYPFLGQAVLSQVNPLKRTWIVTVTFSEALDWIKKALRRIDYWAISLSSPRTSQGENTLKQALDGPTPTFTV